MKEQLKGIKESLNDIKLNVFVDLISKIENLIEALEEVKYVDITKISLSGDRVHFKWETNKTGEFDIQWYNPKLNQKKFEHSITRWRPEKLPKLEDGEHDIGLNPKRDKSFDDHWVFRFVSVDEDNYWELEKVLISDNDDSDEKVEHISEEELQSRIQYLVNSTNNFNKENFLNRLKIDIDKRREQYKDNNSFSNRLHRYYSTFNNPNEILQLWESKGYISFNDNNITSPVFRDFNVVARNKKVTINWNIDDGNSDLINLEYNIEEK